MTMLAPTLEAFFTEALAKQRRASPNTVAAYRDSFRQLLTYLQDRTGKTPSCLEFDDLDVSAVTGFLTHLEIDRSGSVRTRNARLAALRSFFRFAALRHPEHARLIQRVLAIPHQRVPSTLVAHLSSTEVDALLASPDRSMPMGRRDYTVLVLAVQTGLRVGELRALRRRDLELGTGSHVRIIGKGRKERCTPLTSKTVNVLRDWLDERGGEPEDSLFPGRGHGLLSADALQRLVAKHAAAASARCPTLKGKRVTPHVLRHTCAMRMVAARIEQSVIALWLGHEHLQTTDLYIHADLAIKERALSLTAPLATSPGRYRASDALLAFLEGL